MRALAVLLVLGLASTQLPAADHGDNARILEIYQADQQDRGDGQADWAEVRRQDQARRAEVLALLRSGALRTAPDYFRAGIVFQHGETVEDYGLAMALAHMAMAIDPESKSARWLGAAAMDRLLMRRGLPQWYGTQYHMPTPDGPFELYPVDAAVVSDEERRRFNVPSLSESRARAADMGGH